MQKEKQLRQHKADAETLYKEEQYGIEELKGRKWEEEQWEHGEAKKVIFCRKEAHF